MAATATSKPKSERAIVRSTATSTGLSHEVAQWAIDKIRGAKEVAKGLGNLGDFKAEAEAFDAAADALLAKANGKAGG